MDYSGPASTTSGNVKGIAGAPQPVKLKKGGTTIKKVRTMTTSKPPARKK